MTRGLVSSVVRSVVSGVASGVTGSGGGASPGVTTYLEDTFTEASPPVALTSHTMDVGPGWTFLAESFFRVIAGNKVQQQFGVPGIASADASVSDGVLRFTVDSSTWSLIFRATNQTNYLRFAIQSATQVDLEKNVAGTPTPLASATTGFTLTFPCDLIVTLSGNDITAMVVGVPETLLMATDSFNATATLMGLQTPTEEHTGSAFSFKSA